MNEQNHQSLTVRRRDSSLVSFDSRRIEDALTRAFLLDANGQARHICSSDLTLAELEKVQRFTEQVVYAVSRRPDAALYPIDIEDIQDQVELALMRYGEHEIARDYVLYRESRRLQRSARAATSAADPGECEACQ